MATITSFSGGNPSPNKSINCKNGQKMQRNDVTFLSSASLTKLIKRNKLA
jgi:hypothetical protein